MSRRKFVGICSGAALLFLGIGTSGYIERILNLNQSADHIIKESERTTNEIRFIVVGDPHVKTSGISNKESDRLNKVVDFINNSDIDFVIILGDIAHNGIVEEFEITKDIMNKVKKPYYVIAGNHDILKSGKIFESYYGPMEHIEKINGYQLLFVGINADKDNNGNISKLYWSFDFNNANKDLPTIVFTHGPVIDPPAECIYCDWGKDILGYGKSMKVELDKFTNLIGVFAGHVHYDSDQILNGIRHITINGLTTIKLAGMLPVVTPSDMIGYSILKDNKLYYKLVSYMEDNKM